MAIRDNPVIYLSAKLWKYSRGNRRNVVLYLIFFVIANAINLLEPLVIAKLLNVIQAHGLTRETLPTLLFYLSILPALTIGFWIFHGPARVIENTNAFLVRANYKKYLLDGVTAFPIEWHADHHSGDTIDRVEKGTQGLYRYSEGTFEIIEAGVRLAGSYIALAYFDLRASYIVLGAIIFTVFFILQFDKVLVRQYRILYRAENKISEKVFDIISNITTVIILRIEKLVSSAIWKKIQEPLGLYSKNRKVNEAKWFLVSLCGAAMTALVLLSYFYSNTRSGNVILIGTVFALYGYVERIKGVFFRFASTYNEVVRQKAAVMNAEEIANEFSDSKKVHAVTLASLWNALEIDSLRFSYHTEEGADLHLDNVSLRIRRGEKIALIGESGSGKTTFLKIIRELYHPSQVNLSLDGRPLARGFASISSDIALIPQDPEIFSTTIRENITMGVDHDSSYLKKFSDMACFTEVVERLPKKLDSYIFEKGVNLSGGEKQRLALTRGLMACDDKAIVLLDEPTSSVDTKNELRIYQNIFSEFRDKTIIASVHRLHLLSLFDTIYFFEEGRIIASGSLKDLLAASAEFQELWERYHRKPEASDKSHDALS